MPIYVYAAKLEKDEKRNCETCASQFEITQKMSDDSLTKCPSCGGAVERVITPPNLNGVGFMAKKPSPKRMEAAGFTQYKRHGKGYYEKQFGQGPSTLHGDNH